MKNNIMPREYYEVLIQELLTKCFVLILIAHLALGYMTHEESGNDQEK